jgi:glycosyltransferase involved in cell wall biosynthesis
MPNRILIIVENLPVPYDRRVWYEATALVRGGYEVSVICPKGKEATASYDELEGVHIYRHWMPKEHVSIHGYLTEYSVALFLEFLLSLKVFFTRGFDVIQGCNPPDSIFLIAAFYKLLFRRKFVFDHHDIGPELYEAKFNRRGFLRKMLVWMERLTFATADISIATNEAFKKLAVERDKISPERVFVVRTGPKLDRVRPYPPEDAWKAGRSHMVAYVGTIARQDGLHLLLEAIRHIRTIRRREDIQFVIAGDGPYFKEIVQRAREYGIDDLITFTGRIQDDRKLFTIVSSADVCVNPDAPNEMNERSTTIKIMEYMAVGKPSVQFDLVEGRLSAAESSLYAQRGDSADFGEKILFLLDHPEAARQMGELGRRRVEEELSWEHEERKLLAAYDALFAGRLRVPSAPRRNCMLAYTFYETDSRVRRYAEALVKRGDEVDVIAIARAGQPALETIRGVRVFRIQERRVDESSPFSYLVKLVLFFFRSAWMLTVKHFRAPYRFIHVHSIPDFEVFATLVPRLLGVPVILDIHDLVPEFYASKFKVGERSLTFRLLLLLERLSSAFSSHVIISNHLWFEKITRRSVAKEKCTTLINYPDLTVFSQRPRSENLDGKCRLLYPGSLNSHQGLDLAVEAIGRLRDGADECELLIVGDGPDRDKLKCQIQKTHLEDRIFMRGYTSAENIATIMTNADLGVVPKRDNAFATEAFSTKILEFMAMGVPVIVSRTRIDQYYFTEELVEFFEPGSAADLATKIHRLKQNPARKAAIIAAGLKFVEENNWDAKKVIYLSLVNRLTGRN